MPELPEVETIARKLAPVLTGQTIAHVEVLWARTVDRPAPEAFCAALTGAGVTAIDRRGKFIQMALSTAQTLLVHLRMSGKFAVYNDTPGDDVHARLRLQLADGTWVIYIDPRKFGRFYLVDDPREITGDLGPEPLSADFTPEWLIAQLAQRRGEIKPLLLNQRFIAGLGNIYVSEALWQAGIHPQRIAGTLTAAEAQRLHAAIVAVLRAGIENGGTSLEDRQYVYPGGGTGEHQKYLGVYDRAGEQCPRCGYAVERIVQGQRSTYFCPLCQASTKS
ncbi:MAG TPA: bifunctional DNA-formamidopyrimidine glycosylase/DNA-(apurinic or apyrimidinic site) lyase [Anaerolineae bacterium]|nr:bifunctional DNA-formamidopyrimidine glycosylase/DNA-(apurinic or apyrimidinic site) lyase [Anaerolineae bacterium]HQI86254.1 bifunctional DNA-formamidopyrimidine glycosylase/DNA-(apurinic or apyrimidinic site) lyase [Anaerolineae bacterium]